MLRQKKVLWMSLAAVSIFLFMLTTGWQNKAIEKRESCRTTYPIDNAQAPICIAAPWTKVIDGKAQRFTRLQMDIPCGEANQPPCQPPPGQPVTKDECQIPSDWRSNKHSVIVDKCNPAVTVTTYNIRAVFKTPPK